jgi:drug/metabolite transporter (DMT)-like permease
LDKERPAAMINATMTSREWGLLITLALLWGGSFFFTEIALVEVPPFTLVLGRVGIAAAALLCYVHLSGRRMPRSLELWGAYLVMGALNNLIPFSLIIWGQTEIDSGLTAILNATTPLFTVILAHVLTADEQITPRRLVGVLVGLAGVAVLIGPEALAGLGAESLAQFAVLLAAMSYGFAAILGRRFKGQPPSVTAAGMLTATTLMILPISLVADRPWNLSPGAQTWGALLAISLFSSALAYVVYFRILSTTGAGNLMLVTLLMPAIAVLLGIFILGERLDGTAWTGMAVIFAGLAVLDGRILTGLLNLTRRGGASRHDPKKFSSPTARPNR